MPDAPPTPARWPRWRRRLRLGALALLGLCAAGAIGEQIGAWLDLRRFPPPGARVDVGDGRRLYLDCRGGGAPTVVLQSGHWSWSPSWVLVQPQVAAFTRVCSYDRAGLGRSDAGPAPRSAAAVVADEALLLARAGVAPPYVLVGHSAGGMYQRLYQAAHPAQVAGLVLVETDAPGDDADRRQVYDAPDDRRVAAVMTGLTHLGLFRLLVQGLGVMPGPPESRRYPEEAQVRMRADMTRLARAINGEWDSYRSAYRTVPAAPLGDLPLVVIAALGYQKTPADREDWRRRQQGLAALSRRSRLVVLEDEPHAVPFLRPEVVVSAVREVVDQARRPPR